MNKKKKAAKAEELPKETETASAEAPAEQAPAAAPAVRNELTALVTKLENENALKSGSKKRFIFLRGIIIGVLLGIAAFVILEALAFGTGLRLYCLLWGAVVGILIGLIELLLNAKSNKIMKKQDTQAKLLTMKSQWQKELLRKQMMATEVCKRKSKVVPNVDEDQNSGKLLSESVLQDLYENEAMLQKLSALAQETEETQA